MAGGDLFRWLSYDARTMFRCLGGGAVARMDATGRRGDTNKNGEKERSKKGSGDDIRKKLANSKRRRRRRRRGAKGR